MFLVHYIIVKSLIMDCVTAAASLKKLLVAHDHAGTQLSALGKFCFNSYIIKISLVYFD